MVALQWVFFLLIGMGIGVVGGLYMSREVIREYKRKLAHQNKVIENGLYPADEEVQAKLGEAEAKLALANVTSLTTTRKIHEFEKKHGSAVPLLAPDGPPQRSADSGRVATPPSNGYDPQPPVYRNGQLVLHPELKGLWGDERVKIAKERAYAGLPPNDPLTGLWSDDKAAVITYRMKHAHKMRA